VKFLKYFRLSHFVVRVGLFVEVENLWIEGYSGKFAQAFHFLFGICYQIFVPDFQVGIGVFFHHFTEVFHKQPPLKNHQRNHGQFKIHIAHRHEMVAVVAGYLYEFGLGKNLCQPFGVNGVSGIFISKK